jgi:NADH-quinone oxidoreductase subunit G
LRAAGEAEALERIRNMLKSANGVVGIGSPRASLESNYALRRLVGEEHYATGFGAREGALTERALAILGAGPARIANLREVESCDAVLVLGEDPTHTAPRLALSLRQAVRNAAFRIAADKHIPRWHDRAVRDVAGAAASPLHIVHTTGTDLDDVATARHAADPGHVARLGFAVAHAVDEFAPEPEALDAATWETAKTIAADLRGAERPLVVAGTAAGSEAVLQAAAQVAHALGQHGRIFLTLGECNSAGAALLGGADVDAALQRVLDGEADTLVVVENDLYRRAPKARVDAALDAARHLIVIDHSAHATAARADAVLPAGSFAEADGTLVNNEGRAQRFFQVYVPAGTAIRESWRWCGALAGESEWRGLDDVIRAIERDYPALAGIAGAAPGADFRLAGMRMPRAPHRYSGRTAMYANENVHERPPVPDPDSALAYSMEGFQGPRPGALMGFSWAPRWNSNQQSIAKFQDEVAGHLAGGDPGVRLLSAGKGAGYAAPPAPGERPRWLAVPRQHIFGGEPLSAAAPAIAERAPAPYAALHPDDAAELGAVEGEPWTFGVAGVGYDLPVKLDASLVRGCVGLPVGLPGLEGLALPAEVTP